MKKKTDLVKKIQENQMSVLLAVLSTSAHRLKIKKQSNGKKIEVLNNEQANKQ